MIYNKIDNTTNAAADDEEDNNKQQYIGTSLLGSFNNNFKTLESFDSLMKMQYEPEEGNNISLQ